MSMMSYAQMQKDLSNVFPKYRTYKVSMYPNLLSKKSKLNNKISEDVDDVDILSDLGLVLQGMINLECPFNILSCMDYLTNKSNFIKEDSIEIKEGLDRVFNYFTNKSNDCKLNLLLLFPLNNYSYYLALALLKAIYRRNRIYAPDSLSHFASLTLDDEMIKELFFEMWNIKDTLLFKNEDVKINELVERCIDVLSTWSKSCTIIPLNQVYKINPEDSYISHILRKELKFFNCDNIVRDNVYDTYCNKLKGCKDKLSTLSYHLTNKVYNEDIASIIYLIDSFLDKSFLNQKLIHEEFEKSLSELRIKVCESIGLVGTHLGREIQIHGITDIPLYSLM